MNWTVVEIPELRGYVVEWSEPGNYLLSRCNQIYRSHDLEPPFEHVADIAAPFWRELASSYRLGQRLLRFSVNNLLQLSNGDIFVSFDKSIGLIRDGKYLPLDGLVRPCRTLRSAIAVDSNGDLYFGEYISNPDRTPISIYKYSAEARSVEVVNEIEGVRHIHGIYRDPYEGSFLCLAGDVNDECRILKTTDRFLTVETVGSGDESWRAVSALFTERSIYYGTDAEHQQNVVYELDKKTGERHQMGAVAGTVFYSQALKEEMVFATTAENAPSQAENAAVIYTLSTFGEMGEVKRFAKDRWNGTLFGFGTVYFSNNSFKSERLFFHLSALRGDNKTFELILND